MSLENEPLMSSPTTTADVHWRARLLEVQDLAFVAHDVDELTNAFLQLTSILADEWGQRDDHVDDRIVQLTRLVRDASRLLTEPFAFNYSDIEDWQRAAAPYLGEG
jgi:hypothetical protein